MQNSVKIDVSMNFDQDSVEFTADEGGFQVHICKNGINMLDIQFVVAENYRRMTVFDYDADEYVYERDE